VKVGDLVRHKSIDALRTGIIVETRQLQPAHCHVLWSHTHPGSGHLAGLKTIEAVSKLEVISESR